MVYIIFGGEEKSMDWKNNIDDISIICKKCNKSMITESTLNNTNIISVCPKCNEHINLEVKKYGGKH